MTQSHIPEDLAYSESHEWIRIEGNIATIGITDYAQSELGDIVFVEMPDVGQAVAQGGNFGTIEAVKTVEDLVAPASGEVAEINEALEDSPELINTDPYGDGWMIKVRLEDPAAVTGLLDAAGYADLIGTA